MDAWETGAQALTLTDSYYMRAVGCSVESKAQLAPGTEHLSFILVLEVA